jgi:hypothetical protein
MEHPLALLTAKIIRRYTRSFLLQYELSNADNPPALASLGPSCGFSMIRATADRKGVRCYVLQRK